VYIYPKISHPFMYTFFNPPIFFLIPPRISF
jgi:hypothetical protein